jgi:hypothetical protein
MMALFLRCPAAADCALCTKGAGGTHKPGQEAKDVNNGRACNPQPWVTLLCPTCPRPSNASPSPAVARHGSPTKTAD